MDHLYPDYASNGDYSSCFVYELNSHETLRQLTKHRETEQHNNLLPYANKMKTK